MPYYPKAYATAAGPSAALLTGKWQDWQVCRADGILNTKIFHFGGLGTPWGHHFDTLGHHFGAIWLSRGALGHPGWHLGVP